MRIKVVVAGLLIGAAPATERVVTLGETVPVSVNGEARSLRIDPGAPGLVLLTQDYADAARLKGGGLLGFGVAFGVGDEHVNGRTAVARFAMGGDRPARRRIGWTGRPYLPDVDAVVGPLGLDEPVVRFRLHPPREGEHTVAMPLAPTGWLFGSWFGARAVLDVGGDRLLVRFDPASRRTVANALAAQRLAALLGGRFDGEAVPQAIAFGIERPIRPLALARPLTVGPLSITRLAARVVPDLSGGSTAGIKERGDPDEMVEPDDVVVTAKRKGKRRAGTLTLGADQLDRCSSLVFDKGRDEIRLTCA